MDVQPTHRRAERGARERPRGATVLADLGAAFGVVAIGALVLVFDGQELSWLAGLVAGAAAGAWVAVRRGAGRTPLRVPAPARPRTRGARTPSALAPERQTARAIESLEHSGWRFLHDVRGIDTTYDHIAVGPGGVIVMQSLSPAGVITMQSGEPILEHPAAPGAQQRQERLRPRALADAAAFRDGVQRLTGRRLWVQAVVVFWTEFPQGCVADGRSVFIHGSRLAEWMARRPHQLDPREADDVCMAVQALAERRDASSLRVAV
jgi:Nuclease-related domain